MSEATPVGVHLTPGSVRNLSNGHEAGGILREPATPQQVLGNAVHATLAWLYRQPVDDRSVEAAQGALGFYWALEARCCEWASKDQIQAWRVEARRMLAGYLTPHRLAIDPIAVECQLRCVLPTGATISGRADRIDEAGSGIEVVDYKTGRCNLSWYKLRELASVQVYVVAAQQMFDRPVVAVSFHYLRENKVIRWEVQPGEVEYLEAVLDNLAIGQMPVPESP